MAKKRFNVSVREVHIQQISVIAESSEEAIHLVEEGEGTPLDNTLEYSHTLETDTWTAEEGDSFPGDPSDEDE